MSVTRLPSSAVRVVDHSDGCPNPVGKARSISISVSSSTITASNSSSVRSDIAANAPGAADAGPYLAKVQLRS